MKSEEFDPDFGPIAVGDDRAPFERRGRWTRWPVLVRWFVIYPALAFIALNLVAAIVMMIKPFSSADRLQRPVAVTAVTASALTLADGRRVGLPFIKAIPAENRVFRAALVRGVEVDADGEVYGLLKIRPSCGMTAYRYHLQRTNLSELAGALVPESVDENAVAPDLRELLNDNQYPSSDSDNVRDYLRHCLHVVSDAYLPARARRSTPHIPAEIHEP